METKTNKTEKSFNTFTNKAIAKFGNKFTYVKESFISSQEPMEIICPEHGSFRQPLYSHIRLVHGCPKCGFNSSANHSKYDLDLFIEKAKNVHGDKYDYNKVEYIDSLTPVDIYCKVHREYFSQQPASHLRGRGCPKCGFESSSKLRSYTNEEFIEKIKAIQGNEWIYDEVDYTGLDNKVKLICREHGEFYKNPRDLISKKTGCPRCAGNYTYTTEEYIQKAKEVHGDKYDYSKTIYVRAQDKVIITCPKHGDFEQVASGHIVSGYGCPKCKASNGEKYIGDYLNKYNIKYKIEYKILGNNYRYDFYLPDYNIFIEFHGIQHYNYDHFFHRSHKTFTNRLIIDDIKAEIVKQNNGRLIVVPYTYLKDKNIIDEFLKNQLLRHGINQEVFNISNIQFEN